MRLGEQAKVLKDEIRRLLLKTKFPRGMCFDGIKYIQIALQGMFCKISNKIGCYKTLLTKTV
jgi:hypothetical protein